MLLFSDGAFLSGFCTEVLRLEFCSESCTARVLHRECFGASALRLQYIYSVSAVRLRRVRMACPCGVNVKVHAAW